MTDYYLEHRAMQPKKEIADYVESQGILVPRRFETLKEAKNSGLPIIVRSEHPQDYDGASGIIDSPNLEKYINIETEGELKDKILFGKERSDDINYNDYYIGRFCQYLNLPVEQITQEISFSFWEKIRGYNSTIVADHSIAGRYHIMTIRHNTKTDRTYNGLFTYNMIEDNKVILEDKERKLDEEILDGIPRLIAKYEQIRGMDRFDNNHCPIMEFQTFNEKDYFLQYHKTRDFVASEFVIETIPESYQKALFVVGATGPKGMISRTTTFYPDIDTKGCAESIPETEQGAFDNHYDFIFSELMVRKRDLQIDGDALDIHERLYLYTVNHMRKSQLFKPKVSLILNRYESLLNPGEGKQMREQMYEDQKTKYITVHTISDGRNAYIKRID